MKRMNVSMKKQLIIYERLIDYACKQELDAEPGIVCSEMFFIFCHELENDDPFYMDKVRQNLQAKKLLPLIKNLIGEKEDTLLAALNASASGNIIDIAFGAEFDVGSALRASMEKSFAISHYEKFLKLLSKAESLTIATDNAGEIVMDCLLAEHLQNWRKERKLQELRLAFLVKGAPIYNDALREDALFTGCDKIGKIYDTGTGVIGIHADRISEEALKLLRTSDIIISKGLANYESLYGDEDFQSRIFNLFRVKCELIAKNLDVSLNSNVFILHCD
jgi:uncharacterized protein with ATP-grasp and redox domains